MIFAGFPPTTANAGTSFVMTEFAATIAPSPTTLPGRTVTSAPIQMLGEPHIFYADNQFI